SSYEFKLFASILKKIIHSKTAVDLDIKTFDEDNSNPSKRSTSIDFDSPRNIIIFDDIERCKMPINDILGYINYFVEHTSCKVIVICDESKLIEKKSEKENYLFIKEKTIGKTFNFTPNTQQALHEFISEQKAPKINDVYFKNIQKILECYEKSDIKNLRSLRCCLFDFSKLYDDLPHDLKENPQFIDDFLYIFMVIFMGIKTGRINTIHIEKCDMKNLFLDHDNEERKIIEEFSSYINKHSNLSYLDLVLSNSAWVHLIKNEFGIDEVIIEAIKETKYFTTELPLWLTLWNYKRNDIEKTESALKIAIEMLKNGTINSLGELIHIAGVFIIMIKAKAIDMKMKDFLELTEKNIERIISSFVDIPKDDFFLFDDITFFGHGVHEENSPEMKKIIVSLKENIDKKEKEIVNNKINKIFSNVSKASLIPDDTIKLLQEVLVNVNL
ncbi:KAP family NTPase, partial [Providencia rettgeri]|uniref:KAP family NTPase n=4 Tax=Providencia TaxID=586 RepID=UPI001EE69F6C